MKTYVIDLDGTLTKERPEDHTCYKDAVPDERMIAKVNLLYAQGNKIIIETARWRQDEEFTKKQLKEFGVNYSELVLGKPLGDYYIGDKYYQKKMFLWGLYAEEKYDEK